MKKIIVSVTFLAFMATASLGLAATKMSSHEGVWISGKVAAIDENGVLSLREPNGKIFRVAATSDKLKGIQVGDRVVVKDVKGWVASIKETGKRTAKKPNKSTTHKQG